MNLEYNSAYFVFEINQKEQTWVYTLGIGKTTCLHAFHVIFYLFLLFYKFAFVYFLSHSRVKRKKAEKLLQNKAQRKHIIPFCLSLLFLVLHFPSYARFCHIFLIYFHIIFGNSFECRLLVFLALRYSEAELSSELFWWIEPRRAPRPQS